MDHLLGRTTSLSSSSASIENNRINSSDEITVEDFTKSINDWHIPHVKKNDIYELSILDSLFKTNLNIKTEERDVPLSESHSSIKLLSEHSLHKHKQKKFKYIHIGLVQVGIKPLTKKVLIPVFYALLEMIG